MAIIQSNKCHALRKPDPGEPSSLENLEQTEILTKKVYQTEIFTVLTEFFVEQTEILTLPNKIFTRKCETLDK